MSFINIFNIVSYNPTVLFIIDKLKYFIEESDTPSINPIEQIDIITQLFTPEVKFFN